MKDLLKSFTDPTAVDEAEPTGDHYRPVWRSPQPASLDICMGPVQFTINYAHIYLTLAASELYSAFWIILPFMTYIFEGENMKHIIRTLGDREARALYLFNPEVHKQWDQKKGRILKMQPVIALSDAAIGRAADTFGILMQDIPAVPPE
jgi:hypothetical protein